MDQKPVVKMYSDFKSPYAFLAFKPGIELARKYNVNIKWRPFQLRLKGKGQRSIYSEWKVKYSYMDARRHANRLYDGQMLRGPLKIFDTTPSLIASSSLGFFQTTLRHISVTNVTCHMVVADSSRCQGTTPHRAVLRSLRPSQAVREPGRRPCKETLR